MPHSAIPDLLRHAARLTRAAGAARAAALCAFALLAALLLAVVVDAAFALPAWVLFAVDLMLVALAVCALWIAIVRTRHVLVEGRHLARMFEERAGINDSRLINALDFEVARPASASAALVDRSIASGESAADSLRAARVVPWAPVRRAVVLAAMPLLLMLLLHFALPRLLPAVLARLTEPFGNHPPFSLLEFNVAVEPGAVHHGKSARVLADVSGPGAPDRAEIVFVDERNAPLEQETRPMLWTAPAPTPAAVAGPGSAPRTSSVKSFSVRIDRVTESRRFYIKTVLGRSDVHDLVMLPTPLIEEVIVETRPPSYTGWPTTRRVLGPEGVSALVGSEIAVTVASNVPLAGGAIEVTASSAPSSQPAPTAESRVDLLATAEDPLHAAGAFTLERSGAFALSLVGRDGSPSEKDLSAALQAIIDQPPAIEIIEPAQHVLVPEDWPVPVTIAARDDVSIAKLTFTRSVNGFPPSTIELTDASGPPTRRVARLEFDLAALGARGGDVITYFATALDNHPSGEHFVDTATYVIEVITHEEYLDHARSEYGIEQLQEEAAAVERELEELKKERGERLAELEQVRDAVAAGEAAPEMLSKALRDYAEKAGELAERLEERAKDSPIYEFEPAHQEELAKLAEALRNQEQNAQDAAQALEESNEAREQQRSAEQSADVASAAARAERAAAAKEAREQADESAERFKREAKPFDEASRQEREYTAEEMQKLEAASELMAEAERVRNAILAQRDLADRLAEFANRDKLTPQESLRAHRMAEEQDAVKEELESARHKLEELAEKHESTLPNMCRQAAGICEKLGELNVGADQQQAAEQSRAGNGREGHAAAERAAEALETLLSSCSGEGMQQQGEQDLDGCLKLQKPGLRNALKQLAQGRKPGMGSGSNPGSGSMQGMSGSMGQGSGRPTGVGQSGLQGRMTVMGPPTRSQKLRGDPSKPRAGRDGDVNAPGIPGPPDGTMHEGPETLTPEETTLRGAGGGALSGVPTIYRDQAEAYFKRLIEDRRSGSGGTK